MDELILDTTEAPVVLVDNIGGDLRLNGWDQNQVQLESDDDDSPSLTTDPATGQVKVSVGGDCTLNVPHKASIQLMHVGGDAKVKSVEGSLAINFVSGDLVLRQVADADVTGVGGDLNVKKVTGSLSFKSGGDASIRSVSGAVQGRAGGDLYLRDIGGGIQASSGGDAVLSTSFVPEAPYEIKAGSDLLCRILPGISAKFTIRAGSEIAVEVLGARIEGNSRNKIVTLGEGAAAVALTAGSDVSLSVLNSDPDAMGEFGDSFGRDFGVMAEEFASQIESQMAQLESQLEKQINERLSKMDLSGLGVDAEQIAARARDEAQRAADLARRKSANIRTRLEARVEAAEQRAERAAEKHERQGDKRRKTGTFFFKFDGPHGPGDPRPPSAPHAPVPPRAPQAARAAAPVSDEERMAVLKMLEEGKITVQQAETLLAALEGANK